MRVNLVVLGVTKTLEFWRLPSISPKVKKIGIPSVIYQLSGSFEDKNQWIQNQNYPHSYSRPEICLVTARGARARARRSQPGEECEGNLKILLMSIGQSTLPDLYPIVNFSPNYKMWSKWGQNGGNFTVSNFHYPIFILIWSTNFTFGLQLCTAIVTEKFIVHNSERIILILFSQSKLGAKNEVILNFNTYLGILTKFFYPQMGWFDEIFPFDSHFVIISWS